jgi:uncharacterized protein YneF (UPF0154 family)
MMKIIMAIILGVFIFFLLIFWNSQIFIRKELPPIQKLIIDLIYQCLGEKRESHNTVRSKN